MKKLLTLIGVTALCLIGSSRAATVNLAWDRSPELDVTHYILATSTVADWPAVPGAPLTTVQVPQVDPGVLINPAPPVFGSFTDLTPGVTYHFAVQAVNSFGLSSEWSNVVTYTIPAIPPGKPINLRIIFVP